MIVIIPMLELTDEEKRNFENCLNCKLCGDVLGDDRVRDHCHLTGRYRAALHNQCNINYKIKRFIPVFFHNLSSYDSHLFIKELGKVDGNIDIIPINKETYISITKHVSVDNDTFQIRFVDSYRFMASSIDTLSSNLDPEDFKIIKKYFPLQSEFELIRRKGIFPYSYIDSFNKLYEEKLPERENFKNILTNRECSEEDYSHAQNVWKTFGCKNLLDYTELYVKSDTLILSDIFENFRKICKSI